MRYDISGLTDMGAVRSSNQDVVAWRLSEDGRQALLIVADGMGGYQGGEIASSVAVKSVLEAMVPRLEDPSWHCVDVEAIREALQDSVGLANDRVIARRQGDPALDKMGTTLVVAWVIDGCAHITHVGDSRCYLIREGESVCLTRDDTVVQNMLDDGSITAADAPNVPFRNVLTKALGASASVDASYHLMPLSAGDRLLLCSDGLTNALPAAHWPTIFDDSECMESAAEALVSACLDRQAADNVSVVLMTLF
ncbi:PP2C family serine/threonine-protein phosphatase [Marinobacter sp.]|uniref:PP2C family serine/threonine-protein phosphatase n=1 Tax=Marinobacter sp. TaxID=50741 RepID=UPI0034A4BD5C